MFVSKVGHSWALAAVYPKFMNDHMLAKIITKGLAGTVPQLHWFQLHIPCITCMLQSLDLVIVELMY